MLHGTLCLNNQKLREKLKEASPVIKAKLETEATLCKIIDEPREQLKEASPEIQAKLETGKIIDQLRKKLREASPEIKADLGGGIARDQGELEAGVGKLPRSSISSVRSLRRHRQ